MTDGQMPSGEMVETKAGNSPDSVTTTQSVDGTISTASVGDVAQRGMDAAKQVQNLGFADFTASLINGTFDAIVGATVKQMEAYAKLVADLSKSIQQFQTENISDAQVTQHLTVHYPDGEGGTCIRPGYTFKGVPEDPKTGAAKQDAAKQLEGVVKALVEETRSLEDAARLTTAKLGLTSSATSFTQAQVTQIRTAIAQLLATDMIEHLRQMARDGMARIVVTDGEIMSKLTFNLSTTEIQQKQQSNYNENLNRTQVGAGGNGFWWKVKASTDNTNLNVNSMNEQTFDSTLMSTEMIGQVKIRFKTESFPPYVAPQAPPEPPKPNPSGI